MTEHSQHPSAEARFRQVFVHLGSVTAYARRRGSADPEALAAEVMTIAWRRLATVPADDARPWLFATARNLLLAEWRGRTATARAYDPNTGEAEASPAPGGAALLDPDLARALRSLSPDDREALMLVAWEDLSPSLAARALGVRESAFRVRLHRARRRFRAALEPGTSTERLDLAQLARVEDR